MQRLNPPNEVAKRLRHLHKLWGDEIEGIITAYKWAYDGLWQGGRIEDNPKVKIKSISQPTQAAALDGIRRHHAEQALWKVDNVLEDLASARAQMNNAVGPLNLTTGDKSPVDPRQGVYNEGSRRAHKQKEKFQEYQAKRRRMGEP